MSKNVKELAREACPTCHKQVWWERVPGNNCVTCVAIERALVEHEKNLKHQITMIVASCNDEVRVSDKVRHAVDSPDTKLQSFYDEANRETVFMVTYARKPADIEEGA